MEHLSETELVNACLRNERIAQKLLFDKYKNAMYTTALRMLNNSDTAYDVLQDAFIEVFENINSLKNPAAIGGWIKTIVVRKALYKLRFVNEVEPLHMAAHVTDYECNADFTGEELEKAILSLPERARAVFLLIEVEGYKHAEVSEMLSISEGTSKSQLNYSKQLLQKILKEQLQ